MSRCARCGCDLPATAHSRPDRRFCSASCRGREWRKANGADADRARYAAHRDRERARARGYYAAHREQKRAYSATEERRAYYRAHSRAYYAANKVMVAERRQVGREAKRANAISICGQGIWIPSLPTPELRELAYLIKEARQVLRRAS